MRYLVLIGCLAALLGSAPMLGMFGWDLSSDLSQGYQKFHPATFLFAFAAFSGLATFDRKYWRVVTSVRYGPFLAMAAILTLWSYYVSASSLGASGAVGTAVTSFLTPAMLLIAIQALSMRDQVGLGGALRVLMILNSLAGIFEKLTSTDLVYTQEGYGWRSGGLFGHPLLSALFTGMMLVYLLSATNRRGTLMSAMPEIALHALAMFTFGSRSGLLIAPAVIALGAVLPNKGTEKQVGIGQRIGILVLLVAAIAVTQLPIDFIQSALERFTNDSGSADTRRAAFQILFSMDRHSLFWGIDTTLRIALQQEYGTALAIEAAWISLIFTFGLIFVLPLFVTLMIALFSIARALDRSAVLVTIYFLVITAGSVSFASKSTILCGLIIFILGLCQPRTVVDSVRRMRPQAIVNRVSPSFATAMR